MIDLAELEFDLKTRSAPFPIIRKPGIMFRDITTLLGNPRAFRRAVDELVQPYGGCKIDKVAGIEARGFILGGAVAHQLSAGFVPIRKKGKLPHTVIGEDYARIRQRPRSRSTPTRSTPGDHVLLVDDLIATGGTAQAAVKLLRARAPMWSAAPSSSTCRSWAAPPSCARSA